VTRSFVLGTLVVVLVLLLLLPVAEMIVRVVSPQTLPSQQTLEGTVLKGMYVPDDEAGYRLAPGFAGRLQKDGIVTEFSTNSLGIRGPEPGAKTGVRILALGDSFVFGWGVAQGEEWIHVAAEELEATLGGGRVEGWNGGVNGYGTLGALAQLRRLGPELRPDLVLLGFFANDFTDNFLGDVYEVRDGYLFDRFSHEYFQENFLARESHLYRLLSVAWETARVRWLGGLPTTRPVRNFTPAEFERGRERSEQLILALRDECAALGAKFAVIWMPADVYAVSGSRPEDIPLQHELQRRIEAAGVPSLDLLPVATSEPRVSGLYLLPADGHLSVRGNRVMGRAVAKWIVDEGLLGS
jgi:lysophospholipase L1-like esterase